MTYDLETTIQLPDEEDVDVLVEFEVSYWGSPGTGPSWNHPGDPPEGPDFEVTKIIRDSDDDITELVLSLPTDDLYNLIAERIYELDVERYYDDRD